jgi:hypothetical protein
MYLLETAEDFQNSRAAPLDKRRLLKVSKSSVSGLEQSTHTDTEGAHSSATKQGLLIIDVPKEGSVANTESSSQVSVHEFPSRRKTWRRSVQKGVATSAEARFWLLNRWNGEVLRLTEGGFEAKLIDPAHPDVLEKAEFSRAELSQESLAALRPGAAFYWMVGYREHGHRQRERQSVIIMRRGGRMSSEKFNRELEDVKRIWGEVEREPEGTAHLE